MKGGGRDLTFCHKRGCEGKDCGREVKTLILVEQKWKHSQWLGGDNGFFLVPGSESPTEESCGVVRTSEHSASLDFVVPRKAGCTTQGFLLWQGFPMDNRAMKLTTLRAYVIYIIINRTRGHSFTCINMGKELQGLLGSE